MSKNFRIVVPFSPASLKTRQDFEYFVKFCKVTGVDGVWIVDDFNADTLEERQKVLIILLKNYKEKALKLWAVGSMLFSQVQWKNVRNLIWR